MTMKKLILLLCLCIPFSLFAQREKDMALNIVYIGNSITQGALLKNPKEVAPPVLASAWLKNQKGIAEVNMSNQGVSGKTTVDYRETVETVSDFIFWCSKITAVGDCSHEIKRRWEEKL